MTTVFILGSGISLEAGMPSVERITAQVASDRDVTLCSDYRFRRATDGGPIWTRDRRRAEPVLALLHDLRDLGTKGFSREPSYEELSSLAGQLHDADIEYENAAVLPLVNDLLTRPYANGDRDRLRAGGSRTQLHRGHGGSHAR